MPLPHIKHPLPPKIQKDLMQTKKIEPDPENSNAAASHQPLPFTQNPKRLNADQKYVRGGAALPGAPVPSAVPLSFFLRNTDRADRRSFFVHLV